MDEQTVEQNEQVTETAAESAEAAETGSENEIQTTEEILLKLDEMQSSVEHVSIMLIVIFSFFAGFSIAKSVVEGFFRTWK